MDNYSKYSLPIGSHLISPKHDYKIVEVLGMGGFGITYKVSTNIQVDNIPVKTFFCIKEHFISDVCERDANTSVVVSKALSDKYKDSAKTFRIEAERLNTLSGKNEGIVPVNEVFEANNTVYYVMQFLTGDSLRKSVEKHGTYTEAEATNMIMQIAKAVGFLHSQRIAHLDVKPDNVMLQQTADDSGLKPVLIDFGLAKHYDKKGKPTSTIKMQGCSEGYSPVEQYVKLEEFSPVTDVYALAATLFFLLTGKDPKIATEVTEQYIRETLPDSVSAVTADSLVAAMKKEKTKRTQSVDDFVNGLIGNHEDKKTDYPHPTETIDIRKKKGISKKYYIIAACLCLVAGYFFASLFNNANKEVNTEEQLTSEAQQLTDSEIQSVTDSSVDDDSVESVTSTTTTASDNKAELEKLLSEYLSKADALCEKAENKHGDKAMIQVILDAKYYYYIKANSVNEKLNGKRLEANNRITKLVRREYEYWIDKGNNAGKRRKDYAQKKAYYENAYKLVNSDRLQAYIDWLDSHMKKR